MHNPKGPRTLIIGLGYRAQILEYECWVLPPLSNSWIISIIWLYIALNRTPNIDCYWVGAVPNINGIWALKPYYLGPWTLRVS